MSLADIGHAISYGEAIDLVVELQRESGSHLCADLNGWDFAASYGETVAAVHASAYFHVHGAEEDPLPFPWSTSKKPDVTPEELAALKASLRSRSAFAS